MNELSKHYPVSHQKMYWKTKLYKKSLLFKKGNFFI